MASPRIYKGYNGPAPGASAMPKIATGTTIKTLLQLDPTSDIAIVSWGIDFDASAAGVPIQVELVATAAAATVTAFVSGDVVKLTEPANSTAPPLTNGTANSGYTSTAEGSPGTSRLLDYRLVAPTNEFAFQWPLDIEPICQAAEFLRVRVTAPASVSAICNVEFKAVV